MTWDPTIPCAGTDGALDEDRYVCDLIAGGICECIHDGPVPIREGSTAPCIRRDDRWHECHWV